MVLFCLKARMIGCEKCCRYRTEDDTYGGSKHSVIIASEILSQERGWAETSDEAAIGRPKSELYFEREELARVGR